MSPPLTVTEDTPPDMLSGFMDLKLVLPGGQRVRMSVDRRTPMMDLLVQLTTTYKLSPGGHTLQPYGETGVLPYKPNTPIGGLDTWTVHLVPKTQAIQNPASKISLKQVNQPFEQTFRFQVNLPRNQLFVTRVTGGTTMGEILRLACNEKSLEKSKYALRDPKQLDGGNLCEELTVAEYGQNTASLVSVKVKMVPSVSTDDILAIRSLGEKTSRDSSSRSLSPDGSKPEFRPLRKRRPAPRPPSKEKEPQPPVISHSRTSSDSSGYHEASVLSESPDSNNSLPDSLPRRSKLSAGKGPETKGMSKLSRSLSNLHKPNGTSGSSALKNAVSTSSLVGGQRKKKPPPPPPPAPPIVEETTPATPPSRLVPSVVAPVQCPSSPVETSAELDADRVEDEIERMFEEATREHVSLESGVGLDETSPPNVSPELPPSQKLNDETEDPIEWEYKLPAPPTFRDETDEKSVQKSVVAELASVLEEPNLGLSQSTTKLAKDDVDEGSKSLLNNFRITSYVPNKASILRTSSFTSDCTKGPQAKSKAPVHRFASKLTKNFGSEWDLKNKSVDEEVEPQRELESLRVLKSILPALSRSQGALNKIGNEENVQAPSRPNVNINLTTWGERPKRQVSIKSDRDYVIGVRQLSKPPPPVPPPVSQPPPPTSPTKGPKTMAYKTLETGNTRPLKQLLIDNRLPVVRAVELKKKPDEVPAPPPPPPIKRPTSCYLFGCEPTTAPQPPPFKSVVRIHPQRALNPREQLLESIRDFGGRGNLRKVSAR